MELEIEVYKGQSIVYNDNTDKFSCDIELDNKVKSSKRGSLKDLRNEIDQFIKLNLEFKPFDFIEKARYNSKTFTAKHCSAIRKDGSFVVSSKDDRSNCKSYYSKKDMEFACLYSPIIIEQNELIKAEKDAFEKIYKEKQAAIFDKLVALDLTKYAL